MATLYGDADLNGRVDFNDFLVLQASYGHVATRFDQGNFNYDGLTDFIDFLVLQANLGESVTGTAVAPFTGSQIEAITDFSRTHASVPEPAGGAFLAIAAIMTGRRRDRQTCWTLRGHRVQPV